MKTPSICLTKVAKINFCLIVCLGAMHHTASGQEDSFFRNLSVEPPRIGNAALTLSKDDLDAVNSALTDKRPWLIFSDSDGPVAYLPPSRPPVVAYLEPDTITRTLVRGQQRMLRQSSPGKWIVASSSSYAQVTLDGAKFEAIDWSRAENRPFTVSGPFEDNELLSIARFIRETQRAEPLQRAVSRITTNDPIRLLKRMSDGTVEVDLSTVDWSGLRLTLRRDGEKWIVVQALWWVA